MKNILYNYKWKEVNKNENGNTPKNNKEKRGRKIFRGTVWI
jgi:hypothetical protein